MKEKRGVVVVVRGGGGGGKKVNCPPVLAGAGGAQSLPLPPPRLQTGATRDYRRGANRERLNWGEVGV